MYLLRPNMLQYRHRQHELGTIVMIRNTFGWKGSTMHALLYCLKLMLSVTLSGACNTTLLTFNQHQVTVVAAAAQKLTQQVDNELDAHIKRFQNLLDHIHRARTKKSGAMRICRLCEKQLTHIEKQFHALQAEYDQQSPAMVILGPIGAAATVLKEKKITDNLFQCLQELAETIQYMMQYTKEQSVPIVLDRDINKAFDQLESLIDIR